MPCAARQIFFRLRAGRDSFLFMQSREPVDQFIRTLLILAGTGAVAGVLTLAAVITVLVSANFNILNWME
jgi:hypothetical protein